MATRPGTLCATLVLMLSCASPARGAGEPPGAAGTWLVARELYAAAEYESALAMLDRLREGQPAPGDLLGIEQYRAFCLLALGRGADAEQAVAAIVFTDPAFMPSEADFSPRLMAVFRDVRRRTLPVVVQRRYVEAKAAFDRKDFADAAARFSGVLQVLDDPELAGAAASSPLADVKMLAAGFRDLAASTLAPPPLPSVSLVAPAALDDRPVPGTIYTTGDRRVVPPVPIRQALPQVPAQMAAGAEGVVEVLINEAGAVERVAMRTPVGGQYDRLVLDAASQWKYQPATLDGQPVKFRKLVQIAVKRSD